LSTTEKGKDFDMKQFLPNCARQSSLNIGFDSGLAYADCLGSATGFHAGHAATAKVGAD
jgi:hypothetical protein